MTEGRVQGSEDQRISTKRLPGRLDRTLRRARLTLLWESLWPPLAAIATVLGFFLAFSWLGLWLWLPPLGRAIGLGIFAHSDPCGSIPAGLGALAFGNGGATPARPQQWPAAPPRYGRRRRNGCDPERSDVGCALAGSSRARRDRGTKGQIGLGFAAIAVARSLCVARSRRCAGGRDLLRRGRRSQPAPRCRLRLAGRRNARELSCRRLGYAAALYGAASGDPRGFAAGRNAARFGSGQRAGKVRSGRARDRRVGTRHRREGRPAGRKIRGESASRRRLGRAPFCHQRKRRRDLARARRRLDVVVHGHSRPRADNLAGEGS